MIGKKEYIILCGMGADRTYSFTIFFVFFYILQKNFVGEDQREGRKTNKCDNQLREIEISGRGEM
jgi:hypothetical protein